jgi:hypothetical protein
MRKCVDSSSTIGVEGRLRHAGINTSGSLPAQGFGQAWQERQGIILSRCGDRGGSAFSRGQIGVVITEVTIKVPSWIERPIVFVVLLYRWARYGYTFRRIKLTLGQYAMVDPEDYERVNNNKWNAYRGYSSYYSKRKIYNRKNGSERTVYMHRWIMNAPKDVVVDHINHNGLDKRVLQND